MKIRATCTTVESATIYGPFDSILTYGPFLKAAPYEDPLLIRIQDWWVPTTHSRNYPNCPKYDSLEIIED